MALGDWALARSLIEQSPVTQLGRVSSLGSLLLLECELGNMEQAEARLQLLQELAPELRMPEAAFGAWLIALAARKTGNRRWLGVGKHLAKRVLEVSGAHLWAGPLALQTIAFVAAAEGNSSQAREGLDFLEGQDMQGDLRRQTMILGVIAHAAGELEKGAVYFKDEIAVCRKGGYRPRLAWACCDYADLLLDRNSPGDEERAMALLDESLAISKDLGMMPLMERVLSRREILKA